MKRFLRWTAALMAGVLLTACCVAPWGHGGGHGGHYRGSGEGGWSRGR